ncbi:MAG: NAD(P)/FAD-dependent oxidoreductase [Acidobacteriota bacterium]
METCEALIVGAGPAGSSCAWKLATAGIDVLVIDRAGFPRPKPCAGWITLHVLRELQIPAEEYAAGHVLEPIRGFRTGVMGGPYRTIRYNSPVSYAIRREEFDPYLLARSGARQRLGQPATHIRRTGSGWIVNGNIRAQVLVGAGGHFCPIARELNPHRTGPVVAAQVVEFELDAGAQAACTARPDTPEIDFCRDLAGYGWVIRKGPFVNVGFGRVGTDDLPRHVAAFVAHLRASGRLPPGTPAAWGGHAYLLRQTSRRVSVDDGVVLVGDAAGLAWARSGEGIHPAVVSGLVAADTLIAARGDYRLSALVQYTRALEARLGRPRSRAMSAGATPARLRTAIVRRLLATDWFTRMFVLNPWLRH